MIPYSDRIRDQFIMTGWLPKSHGTCDLATAVVKRQHKPHDDACCLAYRHRP